MRISVPHAALLLALSIAPPAVGQAAAPTPIRFDARATSAAVAVVLRPGERSREYGIRAKAGQVMSVALASRGAPGAFSISCPRCRGGAAFRAFSQAGRWSGPLPATGAYVVRVAATEPGERMTLSVAIAPPRPVATPAATPSASPAAHPASTPPPAPATATATRTAPASPKAAPRSIQTPQPTASTLSPAAQRAAAAGAAAAAASVPAPFRAMLARLRSQSGVPLLLPGDIPAEVERPLYASGAANARGYRITLSHAPGCDAHACTAGYLDAERGRRVSGGQRVRVAGAAAAFFTPMACGASCSAPRIDWVRDGVAYGMELSLPGTDAHHRAVLTRLAESALRAGPR